MQAISLLDDLDKELNNYIMRAREWYGWHFPEMSKIVQDNIAYARVVQKMGKKKLPSNHSSSLPMMHNFYHPIQNDDTHFVTTAEATLLNP